MKCPKALTNSDEYRALTEIQRTDFISALTYMEEIFETISQAVDRPNDGLFIALRDVEVDVWSVLAAFSDPKIHATFYIIRESWTFSCHNLFSFVDSDIYSFLGGGNVVRIAENITARDWMAKWALLFGRCIESFTESDSFCESVANLVLLSCFLTKYLSASGLLRLYTPRA